MPAPTHASQRQPQPQFLERLHATILATRAPARPEQIGGARAESAKRSKGTCRTLHLPFAPSTDFEDALGGIPMPPCALNESRVQVLPRAGICNEFMSAAVIGAEGLNAMPMLIGNGRASASVSFVEGPASRSALVGLHQLSATR